MTKYLERIAKIVLTILALFVVLVIAVCLFVPSPPNTKDADEEFGEPRTLEFSGLLLPLRPRTWIWEINNPYSVPCVVKADLTIDIASDYVSVKQFMANRTNKTTDLLDDGSAEFSIPANEKTFCCLTFLSKNYNECETVWGSLTIRKKKLV